MKDIDTVKIVSHWIESSEFDYGVMLKLYSTKSYGWALFLGHISTEKLLKAVYVKRHNDHAPFTHNLYRLAELSRLEISEELADWLDQITAFNLNARYDDYKKEFFQLCTAAYTQEWIDRIKIIQEWIRTQL